MGRIPERLPNYGIGTSGVLDVGHFEDNEYFYFGTGDDARIFYDGTNLVISPKVVGSGYAWFKGDVYLTKDDTKLVFGNDNDIEVYWDGTNLVFNPKVGETMGFNFAAGVTTISGGASQYADMILKSNRTDTYPKITMLGADSLTIAVGSDFVVNEAATVRIVAQGSTNNISINGWPPDNDADLYLMGVGILGLKETSTPTATANYGKIYTKNTDTLYFQDGAGAEHELAFV